MDGGAEMYHVEQIEQTWSFASQTKLLRLSRCATWSGTR